jgi:hypothetical protein
VALNSKIVLYAAGECGQSYYRQIQMTRYCEVVLWVDIAYETARVNFGLPVFAPCEILSVDFDFVVIAVSKNSIAETILNNLIEEFKVDESKIIREVHDLNDVNYNYHWQEFAYVGNKRDEELQEILPIELLGIQRLDVIVRYLVCKDFIYGIQDDLHASLYARMQLARVKGISDIKNFWNNDIKLNVDEMLDSYSKLYFSLKENGYDRDKPIPVSSSNNTFIDGSHRIAASLALEKSIWIKYFGNIKGNCNYGYKWFVENGFCQNDLILILRGYADLARNCGIVILYGPIIEHWEYLTKYLSKQFKLVGYFDRDFSRNFYAFENMIHEIYNDNSYNNFYLDYKLTFLEKCQLKIRVILLQGDDNEFFYSLKKEKESIRKAMYFDVGNSPIIIHASDNLVEYNHMKKVLLSENNLKTLEIRIKSNYGEILVKRLDDLKNILIDNGISFEDVCVVGSSVMEIFGLDKARDLDVIVKRKYFNDLSKLINTERNSIKFENDIELHPHGKQYLKSLNMPIDNDVIIDNETLYFVFNSFKFINLEILKLHYLAYLNDMGQEMNFNKLSNRIRQIEFFEQFVLYFDEKKALKEQIDRSFYAKRF